MQDTLDIPMEQCKLVTPWEQLVSGTGSQSPGGEGGGLPCFTYSVLEEVPQGHACYMSMN